MSLTGHDWIQEALPPWNQQHIREAEGYAPAQQGRKAAPVFVDGAGNEIGAYYAIITERP